jgi:hypothetical protein
LEPGQLKPYPTSQVVLGWGPPEEVAIVRRIFRLFLRNVLSPPAIAGLLNLEAVPRREGRPWSPKQVRTILTNELVIGVYATGKSVHRLGVRRTVPKSEGWNRQKILPAMVAPAQFHEAQRRLSRDPGMKHNEQMMLADLRRLLAKHHTLNRALVRSEGRFPVRAYIVRFGSMPAAFGKVGFERKVRDRQHTAPMGRAEMIASLRGLLSETGYLSAMLLRTRGDVPSPDVLRRAFGSLDAAYAAVGFTADRSEQLRLAHRRRGDGPRSLAQRRAALLAEAALTAS